MGYRGAPAAGEPPFDASARRELVPHLAAWEEAGSRPARGAPRPRTQAGLLGIGFPEEAGGAAAPRSTPSSSPRRSSCPADRPASSRRCSRTASACRTWSPPGDPALIDRVARPVLAGEKHRVARRDRARGRLRRRRPADPRRPRRRRLRRHRLEALHHVRHARGLHHDRRAHGRAGRRRHLAARDRRGLRPASPSPRR